MQKNAIKLADELQKEANLLLKNKPLWQPLLNKGKIHVVGSTYLDLLVFPDLDVYFEAEKKVDILKTFASMAKDLINMKMVTSFEIEKELHKRYPNQVPKGLCLQYRVYLKKRLWKVDIWAIKNKNVFNKLLQESTNFKKHLTKDKRELILKTKYKLMLPFGRTPVGSSYLVYKAVLEEKLDSVDKIISYIKDQGGNVDRLK